MKPRLLLTFANPAVDDPGHLRGLPAERAAIGAALQDAMAYGLCAVDVEPETTRQTLIDRLQDREAMAHVVVFHYAGHASGSALALDGTDGTAAAYAGGIAALLAALPRLELVFLNGCSTKAQVEALLAAGVPAVIATAVDIIDAVATDFATHFYRRLGGGASVRSAFEAAEAAVRTAHADPTQRRNLGRSFLPKAVQTAGALPWNLYVATDDDARWSLPAAADDPLFVLPRPTWSEPTRPYPGVEPYGAADGAVFSGRRHEIRAMYDALCAEAAQLVVLHGPPRSGKTSLLAAGLLPRLQVEHDALLVDLNGWQATADIVLVDDADLLPDHVIEGLASRAHAVGLAVTDPSRITALVPDAVLIELTHLSAAAIEQVVEDPLTLMGTPPDPRLVMRLVDDLTGGASTPITAAVMAELWASQPHETLTIEAYEAVRGTGRLDAFVEAQLAVLEGAEPEWITSGFALELLAHHLTLLGTPRAHAVDNLRARYAHRADLSDVLDAALQTALLVRTATGTQLGHAQLAPFIANHFGASRAPAQQARRIIEERLPAWADGAEGPVLDAVDLAAVQSGRSAMAGLDADAERLIAASEAAVTAAAKRKRVTRLSFVAAAVAVLALAFLWQQTRADNQTNRARADAARAKIAVAKQKQKVLEANAAVLAANAKRLEAEKQAAKAREAETRAQNKLVETQNERLISAQNMADELLAAYPKLEDPTRQAVGVREIAHAIVEHEELVPERTKTVLRAWAPLLSTMPEAGARVARPAVVRKVDGVVLIDRAGRVHTLEGQPGTWMILPGGRFVAVHDPGSRQLRIHDAESGTLRARLTVDGTLDHVVRFRGAPHMMVIVSNVPARESMWQLVAIDGRTGRGASATLDGMPWDGDCVSNIAVRGEAHERIALKIGRQGRFEPAATTTTGRGGVTDCIEARIERRSLQAQSISEIAPIYTRWSVRPATPSERAQAIEGFAAPMPADLARQKGPLPRAGGCQLGCSFAKGGRAFGVNDGRVFLTRGICQDAPGALWLPRWCHTDGRSGAGGFAPDAMLTLTTGRRPPVRRRGQFVLFQGMLLALDTLKPLKLNYAGVAHDFFVSPDRKDVWLLTQNALLHLYLQGDTYTVIAHEPIDGGPLAMVLIDAGHWALQTRTQITVRSFNHDRILWRRPWAANIGGLATNGTVLLTRGDDRLALWSAGGGVPLSPEERIPLGATPQLQVSADGSVQIIDRGQAWQRVPISGAVDAGKVGSMDWASSLILRSTLPRLAPNSRCPRGRTVVDGECWPEEAARQMGRIQ